MFLFFFRKDVIPHSHNLLDCVLKSGYAAVSMLNNDAVLHIVRAYHQAVLAEELNGSARCPALSREPLIVTLHRISELVEGILLDFERRFFPK